MTMHFSGDVPDVETVVSEWKIYGEGPPCYAILSQSDQLAWNCWTYMGQIKNGKPPVLKEWLAKGIKDKDIAAAQEKLIREACSVLNMTVNDG